MPAFRVRGEQVELAAPGVDINSTQLGRGYIEFNGTSMAAPHAAGAAALVIAAGITDTNGNGIADEVRATLTAAALDLGDSGRDPHYGFGLVQADAAVAAVGPAGPPEPGVYVTLSTDKSEYVIATDIVAELTAVVTDENGDAVSGLVAIDFVTTLAPNGGSAVAVIASFEELATAGTYTADLDISTGDGAYTVEVTALSGTDTASFTVSPESTPSEGTATVDSITYATSGGRNNKKHLLITIAIDNNGSPVSGAIVSIIVSKNGAYYGAANGTTGTDGTVTFIASNARKGCYDTLVAAVLADGLPWDGSSPVNQFCK